MYNALVSVISHQMLKQEQNLELHCNPAAAMLYNVNTCDSCQQLFSDI